MFNIKIMSVFLKLKYKTMSVQTLQLSTEIPDSS